MTAHLLSLGPIERTVASLLTLLLVRAQMVMGLGDVLRSALIGAPKGSKRNAN